MQSASPPPLQSFNRIVVFGVGLIGGSFALALKQANAVKQVIGVGRRAETLQRAQALGIIDTIGQFFADLRYLKCRQGTGIDQIERSQHRCLYFVDVLPAFATTSACCDPDLLDKGLKIHLYIYQRQI